MVGLCPSLAFSVVPSKKEGFFNLCGVKLLLLMLLLLLLMSTSQMGNSGVISTTTAELGVNGVYN